MNNSSKYIEDAALESILGGSKISGGFSRQQLEQYDSEMIPMEGIGTGPGSIAGTISPADKDELIKLYEESPLVKKILTEREHYKNLVKSYRSDQYYVRLPPAPLPDTDGTRIGDALSSAGVSSTILSAYP